MSITANLVSRENIFSHILRAEFFTEYYFDGRKSSENNDHFIIITEDYDLKLSWKIHYKISYYNQCEFEKITLDECDQKIYGNFFFIGQDDNVVKGTFDSRFLPFDQSLSEIKCENRISEPVKILMQIFRDDDVRNSLIRDYSKYLTENEVSSGNQVIFVVGEEKEEILANRNIVSARSEKLASMLKLQEKKKTDRFEITHMEPSIFKLLLRFICYEQFDFNLNHDDLIKLIEAAEEYSVKSLVKVCRYHLCENLSVDNVVSVLVVADWLKEDVLKKNCLKFMLENKKEIFSKGEYKDVLVKSRPDLLSEVFQSLI